MLRRCPAPATHTPTPPCFFPGSRCAGAAPGRQRGGRGCWGTPGVGRRPGHLTSMHPAEALESGTHMTTEVQADGPRRGLRVTGGGPGPGGGGFRAQGEASRGPLGSHTRGRLQDTRCVAVSVSCGCCNQLLHTDWLQTTEIYPFSILEARGLKSVSPN